MPQSLIKNLVHITFSTQSRLPLITDAIKLDLVRYLAGIARDTKSPTLALNAMPEHVHLLLTLNKNLALSKLVQEIKQGSSRWVNQQQNMETRFAWQNGYAAFSVSQSVLGQVVNYINHQEIHHRKINFQDELRELLRRHQIEYDERYLWS